MLPFVLTHFTVNRKALEKQYCERGRTKACIVYCCCISRCVTGEALQSHCMCTSKQLYISAHLCGVLSRLLSFLFQMMDVIMQWGRDTARLQECSIYAAAYVSLSPSRSLSWRKGLCCMSDCWQYCSYLGPVGSGKQYGCGITITYLFRRTHSPNCLWHGVLARKLKKCDVIKWHSSVFGMVYWRENSRSVMLLNGTVVGRTMVDGAVACCSSSRRSSTARDPSRLKMIKSREALNMGTWSRRWQVSCAE